MQVSKFIAAVTGLATLLALSAPAVAGSFSISPLRVDFTETSRTAALTVRNEGKLATFDRRLPIKAVKGATERHIRLVG